MVVSSANYADIGRTPSYWPVRMLRACRRSRRVTDQSGIPKRLGESLQIEGICGSTRVDAKQLSNPSEFVADERKSRDINAVLGTRQAEFSRHRRCVVLFHRLGGEHTQCTGHASMRWHSSEL